MAITNTIRTICAASIAVGALTYASESHAACQWKATIKNESAKYVRLGDVGLQWKGKGIYNRQSDPYNKVNYSNSTLLDRTKDRFKKNPSLAPSETLVIHDTVSLRKSSVSFKVQLNYKTTSRSDLKKLGSNNKIQSASSKCGLSNGATLTIK